LSPGAQYQPGQHSKNLSQKKKKKRKKERKKKTQVKHQEKGDCGYRKERVKSRDL
jgi:hypothetical protein